MRYFLILLLIILAGCAPDNRKVFALFVDNYFRASFSYHPTSGTAAGFHEYDNQLDDLSARAVSFRITQLKEELQQLSEIRAHGLSPEDSIDAAFLDSTIQAELFELEVDRSWKNNPMGYVSLAGSAVDGLMKRDFAPKKERLKALTARLQLVPAGLEAMRLNVEKPPREFTDLAIRMAQGSVGFFEKNVPEWARDAAGGDKQVLDEFTVANNKVITAITKASEWLKADLLPRSTGAYAIGAAMFSKKLLLEEMVDFPLDRLLTIGEVNLEKDYQDFVATAKLIDPKKTPSEVMASLSSDHPTAAQLIPATRQTLTGIRKFLIDHKIITLPNGNMPKVEETPPYARDGSFASMDSPGAFDTKATEAFYYVTPPEADWDAKHVEEHLRLYNKPVMDVITIHEAFPGHFAQFLYSAQYPTKTRKLLYVSSNAEGWAHYSEQMMIEEGYGNQDPKLHLAQLSEALLRDCRYVAGIKLHTQNMTVEDATKLFVEKGFQERANGFEEARRGTYNPTYLYYTLGKLMIYKLREDYKKEKGSAYSLQLFHDEFIKAGPLPIPLIREIMLKDKSPTLN